MKTIKINIFVAVLITLVFSVRAEAKWWIFGQSNEEVSIRYMYLNKVSYDESGHEVTLYKETMPEGMVVLNGKASVRKGKIGSVRVTVNDKEKWEDAKLADDGTFEFSFKPELNKEYVIFVEVMNTAGKTNNVEETRKEVRISDRNIMALIREALDRMIEAYMSEDPGLFMTYVSDEFAGDSVNLDRAIRKDFSAFDNIYLRYTLNNIVAGANGRVYVSLNFSRSVISARDGKTYTDKGMTEFVFQMGPARVYSMKNPLIFGLSDPEEVATGTVNSPLNKDNIGINSDGSVVLCDTGICDGGNSTVESGPFMLTTTCLDYSCVHQGFIFADGDVTDGSGDIMMETNIIFLATGVTLVDLGIKSIETVTEVPASGYTFDHIGVEFMTGHCFALRLANGKYAVIEILDWTEVSSEPLVARARFKYKYQTDGSRNF